MGVRLRGAHFFYPSRMIPLLPAIRRFSVVCAIALIQCGSPASDETSAASDSMGFEPMSLKGQWEYRVLTPAGSADGGSDAPAFQQTEIPFDWGPTPEFENFAGCVQFRRALPPRMLAEARKTAIAIDAGHISDVARFYLNDPRSGLIGAFGNDPNLTSGEYRTGHDGRLLKVVPAEAFVSGVNWLYVEICTRPGRPFFWRGAEILLGPANELFENFILEVAVAFLLVGLYVSISLYHLLLAIRRPKEIFNLYFGVFAMAVASFHLANSSAAELVYGPAKELQSKVDQVSLMVFAGSLLLFISRFFINRHSRVAVGLASLYFSFAILDLFVSSTFRLRLLEFVIYSMVFALPYILFLSGREAWRGNKDARLLLLGVALIILGVLHDILVERRVIQSILIMPFTFLAFIMGIALILANRFVRVHSEVEQFAAELEDKVRKRTEDLQATLSEVRELKDRQDGDYFLTAQLLDPLAGNHARQLNDNQTNKVEADFLSRQKKTFRFRHWESELGGDLCAIHSLRLRGRDVLIFFNGDAMGKSMQGAGGALIMGTVFKTIITRTQQSAEMQECYPEHWLRQCYQELKSVLVAFDGRMLVSMVVGIVDEETGMLYFVNAEHPHVVLLRDGQADFFEEKGILRKVGVEDPGEVFVVQTLPMQVNDVVLIGSDGRDDVQIGTNEEGLAIVNEDERAFLLDVEQCHGRLDRLETLIRKRGAVLDDLSLIRIAYREDAGALENPQSPERQEQTRQARAAYQAKNYAEVRALIEPLVTDIQLPGELETSVNPRETARARELMRMLLRACIETEEFSTAAEMAERYTEAYPEDNEVLLWHSFVLRRLNENQRAIDIGERLFMRDPQNARNLRHLARLHMKHGSRERAAALGEMIAELAAGA